MQELEKNVMCVLLQSLRDKDLITQDIHDNAKTKILATLDGSNSLFCAKEERTEGTHGYTQNPC